MNENRDRDEHKASWDEVEKEMALIKNLLEHLPDEDRLEATERIILEAVLFGSGNDYEALGIIEEVKFLYRQATVDAIAEVTADEDNAAEEDTP